MCFSSNSNDGEMHNEDMEMQTALSQTSMDAFTQLSMKLVQKRKDKELQTQKQNKDNNIKTNRTRSV